MEFKSNIQEIIEKLERAKAAVGTAGNPPSIPDFSDAMFSALNSGNGLMKRRIFNLGEDAEGLKLGKYVGKKSKVKKVRGLRKSITGDFTPYEKYRISHGRQVAYKDLEVGGALRRSIETAKVDNGKVVIAITNFETAGIAGYQEQQIGNIRAGLNAKTGSATPAKIFVLSKAEFEQIKKEGNEAIKQVIQKLL